MWRMQNIITAEFMILEDKLYTRLDRDFLHIMYSSGTALAFEVRHRILKREWTYPLNAARFGACENLRGARHLVSNFCVLCNDLYG